MAAEINQHILLNLTSFETIQWPASFEVMKEQTVQGGRKAFLEVMENLIRNPNLTSSYLFRADVLWDSKPSLGPDPLAGLDRSSKPVILRPIVDGYARERIITRRLVPRNPQLDRSLDQTCTVFSREAETARETVVVYIPHVRDAGDMPWYHPSISAVAFALSERLPPLTDGPPQLSICFRSFAEPLDDTQNRRLGRTAKHLVEIIAKHLKGVEEGYRKRVLHDQVVPQARFQDQYAQLKAKYAADLIARWVETTDPSKHVFEDLGIAAFLIELWRDMYGREKFPGFVDIGCGNGVLLYILTMEGYEGWGLDARARKTWRILGEETQNRLKELILLPNILQDSVALDDPAICNGVFPQGTFIISNHADELTGWTPLLAAESKSPFLIIPCCSHNLAGDRYRHPPRKRQKHVDEESIVMSGDKGEKSQYACLSAWVEEMATDLGFVVEREYLRIPSTRNLALIARNGEMRPGTTAEEVQAREGGGQGWLDNIKKLRAKEKKSH